MITLQQFFFADMISASLIMGISSSTEFYMSIISGLFAGLLWNFWNYGYCSIRLAQELKRGK